MTPGGTLETLLAELEQKPILRARASSLSAALEPDPRRALRLVHDARQAAPFDPVHTLREALVRLRSGDFSGVLEALAGWEALEKASPLPAYLRSLALLRQGNSKGARALAAATAQLHPGFAPAQFLAVEAGLDNVGRDLDRWLRELPVGAAHPGLWADLLIKVLLFCPPEAASSVRITLEERRVLSLRPPAEALVRLVSGWVALDVAGLQQALGAMAPDSRAEPIVIALLERRIRALGSGVAALSAWRGLYRAFPERTRVRRAWAAALTQGAVERVRQERPDEAMGLLVAAAEAEPHVALHLQNQAAICTLAAQAAPYHRAWAQLDRLHYRRLLLGVATAEELDRVIAVHRLFARGAAVFRPTPGNEKEVEVDDGAVERDPEAVLQWVHHRRAELALRHLAIGADAGSVFLSPPDPVVQAEREAALVSTADSLGVLVAEEGTALAAALRRRFAAIGERSLSVYEAGPDAEARELHHEHLRCLGELALMCLSWEPGPNLELGDTLLTFLTDEMAFLDDDRLRDLNREDKEAPSPLRLLGALVNQTAEKIGGRFPGRLRQTLLGRLSADLLVRLAFQAYEISGGARRERAESALRYVMRARAANPASATVEVTRARFLVVGYFQEEARESMRHARTLGAGEDPRLVEILDSLTTALKEQVKEGEKSSGRLDLDDEEAPRGVRELRVEELEAQLDARPGAVDPYEALCAHLAGAGNFDAALGWSKLAIGRCLSREAQGRARRLDLLMHALRELWALDPTLGRLFLAGAPAAVLERLEGAAGGYALVWLKGECQLELGRSTEARMTYARAFAMEAPRLHRTVLRRCSEEFDELLFAGSRQSADDAARRGDTRAAWGILLGAAASLGEPQRCLLPLAQVGLTEALAGVEGIAVAMPDSFPALPWRARLAAALKDARPVDRARSIALLAVELHPPAREVAPLLQRLQALDEQAAAAAALAASAHRLRAGDGAGALTLLDALPPSMAEQPRVLRQRVLVYLNLGDLAAADAGVSRLSRLAGGARDELVLRYPQLRLRQQLSRAHERVATGDAAGALAVLADAIAPTPDDAVDLAYVRAFALAIETSVARRQRRFPEGIALARKALGELDALADAGRGRADVLALHKKVSDALELLLEAHDARS